MQELWQGRVATTGEEGVRLVWSFRRLPTTTMATSHPLFAFFTAQYPGQCQAMGKGQFIEAELHYKRTKAKVAGLVAEMWGEQIDSAVVEQRIFPHALAVAERGWTAAAHFAHGDIDYGEVEGRLDKPWAVKSLSADIHLNVRNNSYDCMYL